MLLADPIDAISTAVGEGAIAVLRVSGPGSINVVSRVFRGSVAPEKMQHRQSHLGEIHDVTGVIDQVLLTVFRGPHSYTGEDLVEITCHGRILVTPPIFSFLLNAAARSPPPA